MNYKDKGQGVFIQKDFFKIGDLSLPQKMIFAKVCLLDNEKGCYASNKFFSEFFNISTRQVSSHISNLVNKEYLTIKLNYKKNEDGTPTKEVESRVLKIGSRGIEESIVRGLGSSLRGNSNKDITINKDTINKRIRKFTNEVCAEGLKRNPSVSPEILDEFINYWTEKTRNGKKFLAETKPTFEISKRLNTWIKKNGQFSSQKQSYYERSLDTTLLNQIKTKRV